jgi:hypothetical protein
MTQVESSILQIERASESCAATWTALTLKPSFRPVIGKLQNIKPILCDGVLALQSHRKQESSFGPKKDTREVNADEFFAQISTLASVMGVT